MREFVYAMMDGKGNFAQFYLAMPSATMMVAIITHRKMQIH